MKNKILILGLSLMAFAATAYGVVKFDEYSVRVRKFVTIGTYTKSGMLSIQSNGSDDILSLKNSSGTEMFQILTGGGIGAHLTDADGATESSAASDFFIGASYSATGAQSVVLSSTDCVAGRILVVKDTGGSAGSNNITISTEGSETIDGAATSVIATNYAAVNLICDGTNWFLW